MTFPVATSRAANKVVTLHLRGVIDFGSTRVLRELLFDCTDEPGTHLLADLSQMDDQHEMTLFALLAARARAATGVLGGITAVNPTQRLAHLLVAIGVTVTRELPALGALAHVEVINVGQLRTSSSLNLAGFTQRRVGCFRWPRQRPPGSPPLGTLGKSRGCPAPRVAPHG